MALLFLLVVIQVLVSQLLYCKHLKRLMQQIQPYMLVVKSQQNRLVERAIRLEIKEDILFISETHLEKILKLSKRRST